VAYKQDTGAAKRQRAAAGISAGHRAALLDEGLVGRLVAAGDQGGDEVAIARLPPSPHVDGCQRRSN
jgi:hypothetical protein